MKFLLKLLFLLLSLVAITLIVGLFIDGKFSVKRSVQIDQPQEIVFDYVSNLSNQQDYGVWYKMDPDIKITTTGTDGTVGFVTSWSSSNENVGKGEQEIIRIIYNNRIDTEIRFKEPMEATSNASIIVKRNDNNTSTVTWTMHGESPYPFNILALFMNMDKELGPDLQKGLHNLKAILESQNK